MKPVNKMIAVLAVICIALSACQKEVTVGDDNNIPALTTDSNYL